MNRKGSFFDGITIVIGLFGMALTAVIMILVLNTINTDFQADDLPAASKTIISTGSSSYPGVMDFWIILFLVGMPLISAVLAYFNNIHPLFFWISTVLVVIILLFGASLKVLWEELAKDTVLNSSIVLMPMTNFVFTNYTLYSLFVFIIIGWGTWVKFRGNSGFGGQVG